MIIINEKDFLTKFPATNLEIFEKMNKDLKDTYLSIYMKYSELFNKYLYQKTKLIDYDNKIKSSELSFLSVNEEEMDLYQYLSHDIFRYFYVRNNYYIERLSNEEKEFVMDKFLRNESDLDQETFEFIEKTYKKVIYEYVRNDGRIYDINFGPNSGMFLAPNNFLVLGFRYDEFNSQGKSDDEWADNNNKQLLYLDDVMTEIERELSSVLGIGVAIIKYDGFSAKKRQVVEEIVVDKYKIFEDIKIKK